jgi:hypothetical protein
MIKVKDFKDIGWSRARIAIAFLGLAIIGVIARLTRAKHSFWNDESFNIYVSSDGPAEAIRRISADIFPPLYNVILSIWHMVVPDHELAIRAPSILAGIWVIAIAFLLAFRWFGSKAGFLAGVLVALSPTQALWSQVARPFALDAALAMSVVHLSDTLVRSSARSGRTYASPRLLIAFLIASAGALYTNHGAVIVVLAAAIPLFSRFFAGRATAPSERAKVAGTFAALLAVWLPLIPYLLRQTEHPALLTAPQHNPDFARVIAAIANHAGIGFLWTLRPIAIVLITAAALIGAARLYWKDLLSFMTLISFTAAPMLLCVVLWSILDDIFGRVLERAFWLNVILLCAAAGGFVHSGLAGRAGAGLAVALSVWGLANLARSPPPDWSAAAKLVARLAAPGETIVAVPEELYYSARYYVLAARPDLSLRRYSASGHERPLPLPESQGIPVWLIVATRESPEQVFGSQPPALAHRTPDGRLLLVRFDEPAKP